MSQTCRCLMKTTKSIYYIQPQPPECALLLQNVLLVRKAEHPVKHFLLDFLYYILYLVFLKINWFIFMNRVRWDSVEPC